LDPSSPIPYFDIITLHREYKKLSETAAAEMKPGVLKQKHFQMMKLGKKFTECYKQALLWFKGYQRKTSC
jgi:hypothetical protein